MSRPIRVAQLSQTDGGSGAGAAAYRLHRALRLQGVESTMLVGRRRTDDPSVHSVLAGPLDRARAWIDPRIEGRLVARYRNRPATPFSPGVRGYFDVADHPRVREADIVGLFWVAGAFLTPSRLAALRKPLVWRLSDMWSFTGGCHYAGQCDGFEASCGACPQLASASDEDLSRRGWRRRATAYAGLDLTFVAPSQWIAAEARRSSLARDREVVHIATGVELDRFRPVELGEARSALGLPADRPVIAFGAADPADPRKGWAELSAALLRLRTLDWARDPLVALFGTDDPFPTAFETVALGRLDNSERLAVAYSSADVVVVPSREDNLPNVAIEALACGSPVVGFRSGGMPDAVTDGYNGWLAQPGDVAGLAAAIRSVLTDERPGQPLRAAARRTAETRFDLRERAADFRALYERLLARASEPGG